MSVAEDGSESRIESAPLESCFAPDFDSSSGRYRRHVNLIALELPSTWSDERRFDRARFATAA